MATSYLAKGVAAALIALTPHAGAVHGEDYNVHRERRYARHLTHAGPARRRCLYRLWMRESGWNPWAVNQQSGAYGIPQADGHGDVFPIGRYKPQIRWGLRYIHGTYGNSCAAWRHELAEGWY